MAQGRREQVTEWEETEKEECGFWKLTSERSSQLAQASLRFAIYATRVRTGYLCRQCFQINSGSLRFISFTSSLWAGTTVTSESISLFFHFWIYHNSAPPARASNKTLVLKDHDSCNIWSFFPHCIHSLLHQSPILHQINFILLLSQARK